ncbi:hypothetical protein HY57_17145 [Dyella japonica A8]|uniref:Uncharacterized protein n=1 Tax=Dyella japonica A8 TaxID=1217721 RepID=A0A075K9F6_9GAMM|nr:hypothetical protein HY57_17145 [Dyella japonica A8]
MDAVGQHSLPVLLFFDLPRFVAPFSIPARHHEVGGIHFRQAFPPVDATHYEYPEAGFMALDFGST